MTEDFRTEELLFMMKKISLDLTAQMEEKQGHQRRPGIFHGVYIKASSGRYVSYRIKP